MADKAISQLNAATAVGSQDLFVLEQSGEAKKLTGQILENWLLSYADGHGGIQSLEKTGSTGTNPVIDTYTITYADATTSTFTVTNGLKGDTGARTYVWIKYASNGSPTAAQMSNSPDAYIGVYTGTASSAPTTPSSYTWFKWKGETGDPATLDTTTPYAIGYQESPSGTTPPTGGTWSSTAPTSPTAGWFTWSRTQINFTDENPIYVYSVSRNARDGTGSGTVTSVNGIEPDSNGNVLLGLHLSVASFSSFPKTVSDTRITADMRVVECTWGTPSAVTSDVSWTTAAGSLTLSGSMSGSTTADIILIRSAE